MLRTPSWLLSFTGTGEEEVAGLRSNGGFIALQNRSRSVVGLRGGCRSTGIQIARGWRHEEWRTTPGIWIDGSDGGVSVTFPTPIIGASVAT